MEPLSPTSSDTAPPPLNHQQERLAKPSMRWPSRTDVSVVAAIGVCAVVLAAFWWWSGKPVEAQEVSVATAPTLARERPAESGSDAAAGNVAATEQGHQGSTRQSPPLHEAASPVEHMVTVDIRGPVRQRGVQQLPAGSRVVDAIAAAGGLRPSGTYGGVNLAAILQDGQQIRVGNRAATVSHSASAQSTDDTADETVLLNTATSEELESLPGVGPVLAERIVAWREQHGPFESVSGLLGVSGIGEKVLAGMSEQLRLT